MIFDYVIVGGGSAGSVLAARLSENPAVSVCLLEAGGEGRSLINKIPFGTIVTIRGRPKIDNWAFQTVPQQGLNGRRGYQPRGKALGGSSAINAMLYIRGQPEDYDQWDCEGWRWADILPWFLKSEGNQRGSSELHHADGPLKVSNQQSPRPISEAFIASAEACQIPRNDDFNGTSQEGVGLYQVTQFSGDKQNGERCSAAAAYLHPVRTRPNLTVITSVHAIKILFKGLQARGIEFLKSGMLEYVEARQEVILSSGTFGSPQLLMLSGIGPAAHLREYGIEPLVDLPGVGQNLQDHIDFVIPVFSRDTDTVGLGVRAGLKIIRESLRWRNDGTGMMATPFAEGGAFLKSSPDADRPDLQLHFALGVMDDHARKLHLGYGYSLHVCVLRPHSRGEVRLQSRDPLAPPHIDPHFLEDERDARTLLAGARKIQTILNTPPLVNYRKRDLFPLVDQSDEALMQAIRNRADSVYHPVGTCKMGQDSMSVVDTDLKVHRVAGLRVIDASIMPNIISGNTNAPVIAIAEKMAAEIANEFALSNLNTRDQ